MICWNGSPRAIRPGLLALSLSMAAGVGCSQDQDAVPATPQQAAALPTVPDGSAAGQGGLRADQLAAVLLAQFPEYDECPRAGDPGALRYLAGSVDLDGGGRAEVVALTLGREACGSGGCTAFVLRDSGTGYQVVTRMASVSAPILAAATRSDHWRDLIVGVGGGGAEPGARVLRFSGKGYPENASLAPPAGKGVAATPVIADAPTALAAASLLVPAACAETASVAASESLGGLHIGSHAAAAERLLGPPKGRGKSELWEADGLYHREWTYPAAGVVIGLSAPNSQGPWEVFSMHLKAPAKLMTGRGIGIGASRKEVLAAYGRAAEPGESGEPGHSTLTVGTDYDALVFSLNGRNQVAEIFLGALAE
jgi:hypothetical protein